MVAMPDCKLTTQLELSDWRVLQVASNENWVAGKSSCT